jgi:hypothetical protein
VLALQACGHGPGPTVPTTKEQVTARDGPFPIFRGNSGNAPTILAIDDDHVYGFNTKNTLVKVPKDGGEPRLLIDLDAYAAGLAVGRDYVYLTDPWHGMIRRVPKNGGIAETIATDQAAPVHVIVQGPDIYWTNKGRPGEPGGVMRVPVDGGPADSVAVSTAGPVELAASGTDLFYVEENSHAVVTVPKAGGSPRTLAVARDEVVDLHADDTSLIWATKDGAIFEMALSEAEPRILVEAGSGLVAFVADTSKVYWVNEGTPEHSFNDGTIVMMWRSHAACHTCLPSPEVSLRRPRPRVLAWNQRHPTAIAVDDSSIYWSNKATSEIVSMAKPAPRSESE